MVTNDGLYMLSFSSYESTNIGAVGENQFKCGQSAPWPKKRCASSAVNGYNGYQWRLNDVERTFRILRSRIPNVKTYVLFTPLYFDHIMQFTEAVALLACLVFQKHFQMF